MEHQALRPPHGKCRNHHRSATPDGTTDDFGEGIFRIQRVMPTIAVGRLNNEIVGIDLNRIDHGRVIVAAEVAGEDNLRPLPVELNGGCAEDMTARRSKVLAPPGRLRHCSNSTAFSCLRDRRTSFKV